MATTKKTGKAVGTPVEKKTVKGRQVVVGKKTSTKSPATKSEPVMKAAGSAIPKGPKGHRGCVQGTRKETIAKLFDAKGADAAKAKGAELGLKPNTIKSWLGIWVRSDKAKLAAKGKGSK